MGATSPSIRIRTCVVQRLEEPAEPGSRLPIFSSAAKHALFVLCIYIRPWREPALGPAWRKTSAEGSGAALEPAFWSHPPFVPTPTAGNSCGITGVLWLAAVWATPPRSAHWAWCMRGLGQSSFTHSPNIDPRSAPPTGARQQGKKASKSEPCPWGAQGADTQGNRCADPWDPGCGGEKMERPVEIYQAEKQQEGLLDGGKRVYKDLEDRSVAGLERMVGRLE